MADTNHKIKKIFIANRGEIALRIARTCKKLSIEAVLGVSEADRESLAARTIRNTELLGAAPAALSYLNIPRIIEAAQKSGADAVHPGYGFLSENHVFARAVIDAGLIWIGPTPEAIEAMGSKTTGRAAAQSHGVPVTPGTAGGLSDEQLGAAVQKIGFPLLIKAVGGGGGRGMRVIRSSAELRDLLPRARAEAKKFFSNDDVFLERYVENPRHIEVQVVGDSHGNLIHLGTRDCTIQRRHQKLVEEAPAPFLSEPLRKKIHAAALAAARSVGYSSAGTVEFLFDGKNFFFLEMNTRIQVEHPVTEEVTGLDLIQLQIEVAEGKKLALKQSEIRCSGHAIEFRINAENSRTNFTPTTGKIVKRYSPAHPSLREEVGYETGDELGLHYDGLLQKIIVRGTDRLDALKKSAEILGACKIEGLETTLPFHRWLVRTRQFVEMNVDIGWVEREFKAEFLDRLAVSEKRDPVWRAPIGAAESVDQLEYCSTKNQKMRIMVRHAPEGFFIATCEGRSGARASNLRETAVQSLIDDVIERPSTQKKKHTKGAVPR